MPKCKKISQEKSNGRVYTPDFIVNNILDLSGYISTNILCKHVIDNSCGDGAFLMEIVKRYCKACLDNGYTEIEIKKDLSKYIHGVEIDEFECKKCKNNLDKVTQSYGITDVCWDIKNSNTLLVHEYDNKMDFVLGNPPYIRIHNVNDELQIKKFSFSQFGMTDLFITFYEIGLNMLNDTGVLGYITPSSYFNSQAATYMRKYFLSENLIQSIVDLKHLQVFSATTYSAITILNKNKYSKNIEFYEYDLTKQQPYFVDELSPKDFYISTNFIFSTKHNLSLLKKIYNNLGHCDIEVKNGYATLCDSVYINDFQFESQYIIPAIKASKGLVTKMIYPYDEQAIPIPESVIRLDTKLYDYLIAHKPELLNRSKKDSATEKWYTFGRSQALKDTFKDKLTLNTLLRNKDDIKMHEAPAGTGVYGGLYIISNTYGFNEIQAVLKTDEFVSFITLLGKYKSGGYYSFSTKDVKLYLDYKFAYNGGILANE